ncbi:unnamed protein product [Amoebophrya sp. A25]|nr:unnamed protein product [Amoebophrya sp. A25]|eukprot:GSA25T00011621001.1
MVQAGSGFVAASNGRRRPEFPFPPVHAEGEAEEPLVDRHFKKPSDASSKEKRIVQSLKEFLEEDEKENDVLSLDGCTPSTASGGEGETESIRFSRGSSSVACSRDGPTRRLYFGRQANGAKVKGRLQGNSCSTLLLEAPPPERPKSA